MYTTVTLPLIPLRASDDERSEMVSQLLFGQQIEILETSEKWYRIQNLEDGYEGWISKKTVDKKLFTENKADTSFYTPVKALYMLCLKTSIDQRIIIPGGSLIPPIVNDSFVLQNETYKIIQYKPIDFVTDKSSLIVELATQYFNAPYLWGGKSPFGIDCSGLIQIIYSMAGVKLPRDASQQVACGTVVDFLAEAKTGDLAFFENDEGKIIHVGILVYSHQVIHASGFVKIEIIDTQGIISSQTGEYTHKLRVIKRVL